MYVQVFNITYYSMNYGDRVEVVCLLLIDGIIKRVYHLFITQAFYKNCMHPYIYIACMWIETQ